MKVLVRINLLDWLFIRISILLLLLFLQWSSERRSRVLIWSKSLAWVWIGLIFLLILLSERTRSVLSWLVNIICWRNIIIIIIFFLNWRIILIASVWVTYFLVVILLLLSWLLVDIFLLIWVDSCLLRRIGLFNIGSWFRLFLLYWLFILANLLRCLLLLNRILAILITWLVERILRTS